MCRAWDGTVEKTNRQPWAMCFMPTLKLRCRSRPRRRSSNRLPRATSSQLYEMAHRVVFTLIMRITANRETAEELTVDVFHDVWRRASRYDAANGTVLGWIMNQARSRAIDRLRFESRKKRSHGGDVRPLDRERAADECRQVWVERTGRRHHSDAIGLIKENESFLFYVEDDGPGFDLPSVQRRSSGLALVQGLARQLGGKFEVVRTPATRCSVRFQ